MEIASSLSISRARLKSAAEAYQSQPSPYAQSRRESESFLKSLERASGSTLDELKQEAGAEARQALSARHAADWGTLLCGCAAIAGGVLTMAGIQCGNWIEIVGGSGILAASAVGLDRSLAASARHDDLAAQRQQFSGQLQGWGDFLASPGAASGRGGERSSISAEVLRDEAQTRAERPEPYPAVREANAGFLESLRGTNDYGFAYAGADLGELRGDAEAQAAIARNEARTGRRLSAAGGTLMGLGAAVSLASALGVGFGAPGMAAGIVMQIGGMLVLPAGSRKTFRAELTEQAHKNFSQQLVGWGEHLSGQKTEP